MKTFIEFLEEAKKSDRNKKHWVTFENGHKAFLDKDGTILKGQAVGKKVGELKPEDFIPDEDK